MKIHAWAFSLTNTRTYTEWLLPSCNRSDVRLPAADAAAANANAKTEQSLKPMWKTATYDTETDEAAHCRGAISPSQGHGGKYSLKSQPRYSQSLPLGFHGWTVLVCSVVVMICMHIGCLPPVSDWQKSHTQPPQCKEKNRFHLPPQKGGGKKGGPRLLFWSFHVPPWSCQMRSSAACRGHGGRTKPILPSPSTRPCSFTTHLHSTPPPPTPPPLTTISNRQNSSPCWLATQQKWIQWIKCTVCLLLFLQSPWHWADTLYSAMSPLLAMMSSSGGNT